MNCELLSAAVIPYHIEVLPKILFIPVAFLPMLLGNPAPWPALCRMQTALQNFPEGQPSTFHPIVDFLKAACCRTSRALHSRMQTNLSMKLNTIRSWKIKTMRNLYESALAPQHKQQQPITWNLHPISYKPLRNGLNRVVAEGVSRAAQAWQAPQPIE